MDAAFQQCSGDSLAALFADATEALDELKRFDDELERRFGGELAENLRGKGFRGKFIVPLPEPAILEL